MRENIIRACRDQSALIIKLFNALMNVVDLINNLNTSIVNYEAVNKSNVQIYMQTQKENDNNNETWIVDRQYHKKNSDRFQHRGKNENKSNNNRSYKENT